MGFYGKGNRGIRSRHSKGGIDYKWKNRFVTGDNRRQMKGFAAFGAQGEGLSDIGYARYIMGRASQPHGTVIKNPLSYLMGMAAIGLAEAPSFREWLSHHSEAKDTLVRAQERNPEAPLSELIKNPAVQRSMLAYKGTKAKDQKKKIGGSQFGAITTGRGKGVTRGYPAWVIRMLQGANTELGKPPETGSIAKKAVPVGLALIALKVLL